MINKEFSLKRATALLSLIAICLISDKLSNSSKPVSIEPIERYGYFYSITFYTIMMFVAACTSPYVFVIISTTLFKDRKTKKQEMTKIPEKTICFRVVTRGMFPELIKKNLDYNLGVIKSFENLKYTYEVVTDSKIGNIEIFDKCYEVVVPGEYETKTGAKFKARALQYALEKNASNLEYDDWIVHLDEESRLTKSFVIGVMNFANDNKHQIGQGLITYGKGQVVNWMNTLTDSIRCSHDLGTLRATLKYLHRPIMNFKGSFFVCKNGVEQSVTFDHGFEGSIAEDSFFVIKASNKGFTFNWIEGELQEQSPFTFMDFLRQRRRWYQGAYYVAHSKNLERDFTGFCYRWKFFLCYLTPISTLYFFLYRLTPVSFFSNDHILGGLIQNVSMWYFYWLGLSKNIDFKKVGIVRMIIYVAFVPLFVCYSEVCESLAFIWAMVTPKTKFDIVKKLY